jgi:hypothetical protein
LSPSPEHVEYAATLPRLAYADLYPCRVLADHGNVADGAVGSYTQQAVEKELEGRSFSPKSNSRAATTLNACRASCRSAPLPNELASVDWLTRWAVALRDDEPAAANSAGSWAKALLDEAAPDGS